VDTKYTLSTLGSTILLYPLDNLVTQYCTQRLSSTNVLSGFIQFTHGGAQIVFAGSVVAIIKALLDSVLKVPLRLYLIRQLQFSPNHPQHFYESEPPSPKIEPPDQLIVETVAGGLSVGLIEMFLSPLNLIKFALQTNYHYINAWDATHSIVSKLGFSGLYSGATLYFTHHFIYYSIYYLCYISLKKFLFSQGDRLDAMKGRTKEENSIVIGEKKSRPFSLMASHLMGGMIGGLLTYPLYSLKMQYFTQLLSDNPPNSIFQFIKNTNIFNSMDLNGLVSFSLRSGLIGSLTLLIYKIFSLKFHQETEDDDPYNYPTFRDGVYSFFNK